MPRPPISSRFTFAPGALAIGGAVLALLVAARAPVGVQLFTATLGALLGMWAVRMRAGAERVEEAPSTAAGAPAAPRKIFPADTRRLCALGDAMLYKCRKEKQPLSLAVFDFSDLPELQAVFEGRIANGFGSLIARRLQLIAPVEGVVVRTGPTSFAVLLPNFDGGRARLAIRAALGRACCIEFDVGHSEILLVPEFAAQTVRGDAESIEQVYQQLRTELAHGLQHTERRQDYLRRERESHTRPMRLAPAVPMAATMPVSLALR